MSDKIRNIQHKFKKADRECDHLLDLIHKKDGFILKEHRYSGEELLNGRHYQKINSITEKIGDDIEYWEVNSNLDANEKEIYLDEREIIEDRLHDITKEINNREPTFWEKVRGSAKKFIEFIMKNLPLFERIFLIALKTLTKIPYFGKIIPPIFYITKKVKNLIPHKVK